MRKIVENLSHTMSIIGGIILCLLILLTCVSVAGRALNTLFHGIVGDLLPNFSSWMLALGVGPINGDFELVEAGVAFAIFAFLPICQYKASHAVVDVFAELFGDSVNRFLRMISEIIFSAVLILITVQLFGGMLAKRQFGETTFLLQFPVWWSYALSLVAAIAASFVSLYMSYIRVREFLTGSTIISEEQEADH